MNKILYAGYGANRDLKMMQAITGNSNLVGKEAILRGVELCVQGFDQIPDIILPTAPIPRSPKSIMIGPWGENSDFQTYVIRYSSAGEVACRIFEISPLERALVAEWEMIAFGWFKEMNLKAYLEDGSEIAVTTEGLNDDGLIKRVVDGINYPDYLLDPEQMCNVATKARLDFLARM
jgi:hypothetical protein